MKKIAVFTSGGDAPGMNAAIRAVVRTGLSNKMEVVGIKEGYKGMIEGQFELLTPSHVNNIIQRGGTILNSSRSMRFFTKKGRKQAYNNLKREGIEGIVAIGGDGTFTGADIFSNEFNIPIIGIPGTIDNDLYGTDHTIGYDTALNTVVEAIDKIRDTAESHHRMFFVEVMGRDRGFIALNAGIAGGAEAILIPEVSNDTDHLIDVMKQGWKSPEPSVLVIVAEGEESGGAFQIAKKVKEKFPDVESRVTVLGHIQRGGSPSCFDRILASRLGIAAVEGLLYGRKNVMAGLIHKRIVFTPLMEAIKEQKPVNQELLRIVNILAF